MFFPKTIYNLGIRAYYLALYLASFFNKKAKLWVQGRTRPIKKIAGKSIWFHCASLGEFEQARPLIEYYKQNHSDYKIVLTFFSPSGYEIRKNYKLADYVYYLPLDTKSKAKHFISAINPELVLFVKYEFWYHFLNELHQKNITTYLISGIFRENQLFFKSYGGFYRSLLQKFTHLFVQDKNSLQLLESIDIKNTSLAKDTRFDRVLKIKNDAKQFPTIESFIANSKCIVLGSTWLSDEKLFASLQNTFDDYKLIIAPHNISKKRIQEVQSLFKNTILYSKLNNYNNEKILLIDNIGMLSSIYQYATFAYIGGGFETSIHNILEAAVYKIPVLFGPAHHKMKEATDLLACGGAFKITNEYDLINVLDQFKNEAFLAESAQKAGNYVQNNAGGTEKIIAFIKKEHKSFTKQ